MRKLPNGYAPLIAIYKGSSFGFGENFYYDTGIVPTDDTDVNVMFDVLQTPSGSMSNYVFGARNSNSNTSAGQLNFLFGTTSYFGYASARASITHTDSSSVHFYVSTKANKMKFNAENSEFVELERPTATFTGTRNIYAMAMNNGGTPAYGTTPTMGLFYMSISKGGQLISELYPVTRYDGQAGLYDIVQNRYIASSGTDSTTGYSNFLWVSSEGNGKAFIRTPHGEYSHLFHATIESGDVSRPLLDFKYTDMTIEAVPNEGYVFSHWENDLGRVVSYDRVLYAIPENANDRLTANFKKVSELEQTNSFMLMGIQYGEDMPNWQSTTQANVFDLYTTIKSFSIKEDGLTKTTSTIVLHSMPSAYQINMPVAIYTNKGQFIWCGIVESIEGNTLNCREALSIVDEDFVFVPNTSWGGLNLTNYTLMGALEKYAEKFFTLHTSSPNTFTDTNDASKRKGITILGSYYYASPITFDRSLAYDNNKNVQLAMPLVAEAEVKNFEDYLMDMFNSTGYGVVGKIHKEPHRNVNGKLSYKSFLNLEYYYPNRDEVLVMSDNYENIKNVEVSVESQQPTVLEVYNETGTTCRGVYGMQTDGTITDMLITAEKPLTSFIGYNDCRTAVVMSNDNLNTILVQNLTNSMFNHNITFDLDISHGLYTFDDFTIGRRVRFYKGNQVFESVVTGKEYSLMENDESIRVIRVTLGKVRKSLTAKIKLSDIKKK